MSHEHQVASLASSFVEMAKAFEELPRIKAELAEANRAFSHASDTIQRLELKLIDRNTTIDELNAKVRETEVARDDAELRFLEADEKLGKIAKALQTAGETVGLALRKPEPVVAEPIPEYIGERPLDAGTTLETPSNEPLTESQGQEQSSSQSPVAPPSIGSTDSTMVGGDSVPPSTYVPSSLSYDRDGPAEAREESGPVDGVIASEETSLAKPSSDTTTAGQRDPLPTVASPIDASTAGNTVASPSGGANSPTDDEVDLVSYANEPADKWTQRWREWADKMDRRYGRYNWPVRATA